MPGGDRTGPLGDGPASGWGRGFCGGARRGRGFGLGWRRYGAFNRRGFYVPLERETETLQMLKKDLQYAEEEVSRLQKRISEIEKER